MLYDKMDELASVEIFPGCSYYDELQKALPYLSGEIIDYLYDLFERRKDDLEWTMEYEEPDDGDYYRLCKIINATGESICEECEADSDDPGFIGDWKINHSARLFYIEKGQTREKGISWRRNYITLSEFMEDLVAFVHRMSLATEGHRTSEKR